MHMRNRGIIVVLAGSMLLVGCESKGDDSTNRAAASNFVPPSVRPPTPVKGLGQQTPLTAYVGRYPHDAVDGVDFFDRTEVATALVELVGDDKIRQAVTGRAGPQTPIFARGPLIASWGCEAHDCGNHNWTLMVDSEGKQRGQLCYHDASMGDVSRWYGRGQAPQARPGVCPGESTGTAAPASDT